MAVSSSTIRRPSDPIVNIMLNGARVTAGFRASLFAAASRAGLSVSEFCLKATAEHLATQGYGFAGVFEDGDMSAKALLDPFAGDQSRAVINFGADGAYVTAAEKVAFDLHKPKGMAWVAWTVELMREKVISNIRRVA